MAATLFFTLHPLRSLRASQQAAKKGTPSGAENSANHGAEAEISDATAQGKLVTSAAKPGHERVNVQSSSRVHDDAPASASEQALLAARLRIDV
ncbi:MAG TPA: hypothetical protein VEQ58_19270 [Polyangiaceae bacterium]|nr:hypothetical protein [Polyangiaceae bacterium]